MYFPAIPSSVAVGSVQLRWSAATHPFPTQNPAPAFRARAMPPVARDPSSRVHLGRSPSAQRPFEPLAGRCGRAAATNAYARSFRPGIERP